MWSLLQEGKAPLIQLIEETAQESWEDREKYWIAHYPDLYNQREGGAGVVVDRSRTSIQRSADAHKRAVVQLSATGDILRTYDSIKSASNSVGVVNTAVGNAIKAKRTCAGYYWAYADNYNSAEFKPFHKKLRCTSRCIHQYSEAGVYICSYDGRIRVQEALKLTSTEAIVHACEEGYPHLGYYWSYDKLDSIDITKAHSILQVDSLTMAVVRSYLTSVDAAKALGRSPSVMTTLTSTMVERDGYYWVKKEDYDKLKHKI